MIWSPFQYNKKGNVNIFTHVTFNHYSSPKGYCFDAYCKDEPIKDDPSLSDYNVDIKASKLVDYFKVVARHYKSRNIMQTMGDDFQYTNTRMQFKNIDKLIKYINSRP